MTRVSIMLLIVFLVGAVAFFMLDRHGVAFLTLSEGRSLARFFAIGMAIGTCYEIGVLIIVGVIRYRRGAPAEIKMLASLLRAVAFLIVGIGFLSFSGKLPGSWAAVAGFAGLLMGWSLQAPVSGLAAWVFVNIKRPFRMGDRVMLPAWGLTGDVTRIGMMYVVLNQVGGTVGSEESAGRYILIPNAMLFGNIVINFTPLQSAAYVLDEVIIRITYNSNWDLAEKILLDAASMVTGDIIQETGQKPYIRADMYDYGVLMRLRYMTMATDRPRIVYEITRNICHEFQKYPDVDFSIPYVFSHRTGLRAGAQHLERQSVPETEEIEIDVDHIHDLSGVGERPENLAQVQELAKKIQELGLLQPIVVEGRGDGQYNVIAGQFRLAGCKMLGWKTIPAIVSPHV